MFFLGLDPPDPLADELFQFCDCVRKNRQYQRYLCDGSMDARSNDSD